MPSVFSGHFAMHRGPPHDMTAGRGDSIGLVKTCFWMQDAASGSLKGSKSGGPAKQRAAARFLKLAKLSERQIYLSRRRRLDTPAVEQV